MKQYRCLTYVFAVLLVLLASCTSRSGGSLEDKGNIMELTTKEHSVKAMKMGQVNGTYILLKASEVTAPDSIRYLDGRLSLMPKEEFDKLKAQYGNIKDRANPGHAAATKLIKRMSLIAADRPAQKRISKLIEMSSRRLHPLIRLTMTELSVTELTYQKQKVFLSGDLGRHYLVSKVEILEDNHSL